MRCLATALHPNIQRFYLLACLLLGIYNSTECATPTTSSTNPAVSSHKPRSINAIGHPSSLSSHISFRLYLHPLPPYQWPDSPQ
ncbi:hypothetical protein M752DRAFT_122032 [Aspergillus phoenicis ATCC 13157]|uniref:Secreted protein n=1 Tax=Aspergillus phoenicis ATCC 13157 TaxID=1353007 RepID=A0A370PUZ4_ASPPH|nr:hypothetical protein M752DRAFT_122032 [Aspergillus phoenicis ATCC 13157]